MIPSLEEISKVMLKLNPNKALGPDGLCPGFYKAAWGIVGPEVCTTINRFFISCFLTSSANATILSLVPKHPGAARITDYRPISCCHSIYKVLSKLLVNRLKPLLPSIILPTQTAFVKDMLLMENTILAGEIVNGYHRDKGPKKITIKVDIAKAFDTLSWEFLFNCLQGLNLPPQFTRWLQAAICTTNFTIGYNGCVQGYFKGKRGLRQGDPLSPYLFVIAMNYLCLMLNQGAQENKFKYHHKCSKTKLTHLCFADDLLIFLEGSLDSVEGVLRILDEFNKRSGLAISIQKSCFFSSGLSQVEILSISSVTGLPVGTLPIRYLGVPLNSKKLDISNCEALLHQVKKRITSWTARFLSFAGRVQLINTVIAGISNFWCSTFVIPKSCIKKIDSMCGSFLWKGTLEGRATAKVAWETVTKPKDEGGLGVRDLLTWNKACTLKLIWLLFFRSGSVWVAWFKEQVLKGSLSNFWTLKPSQSNSWLANKLLKIRDVMFPWITIKVGNGRNRRFWSDNWSELGSVAKLLNCSEGSRLGIPIEATLSSLFRRGVWRIPHARSENQVQVHVHLSSLVLNDTEDVYQWVFEGKFTNNYKTGEVYKFLRGSYPLVPWSALVWSQGGIPKHRFHSWLVTLNRCPTRDRLLSWGLSVSPTCLLCNLLPESRNHLYFECAYSSSIWSTSASRCGLHVENNWDRVCQQLLNLSCTKLKRILIILAWQCTLYLIWSERNERLHKGVTRPVIAINKLIDSIMRNRASSFRDSNHVRASKILQLWLSTA